MTQNKPMLELVLNLLTPFLIAGGLTDPTLARQAAAETIAAYNAPDQPLTVAQIITFALAAIDNLRLSLPEDVSLSMKLKLRGNANALNRASQKAAASLETTKPQTPADPPTATPTQSQDQAWAAAMTDVATEYTAKLANLPPAQHRTQRARIDALSDTAHALNTGKAPPFKARLLGGTAMQQIR